MHSEVAKLFDLTGKVALEASSCNVALCSHQSVFARETSAFGICSRSMSMHPEVAERFDLTGKVALEASSCHVAAARSSLFWRAKPAPSEVAAGA